MVDKGFSEDNIQLDKGSLLLDDNASVNSLEKIYEVFAASAKRWESIVYPSMAAFIILAIYGFYLIYSLTTDVTRVVDEMKIISGNMVQISSDINRMSGSVVDMSVTVQTMSESVSSMDGQLVLQLDQMKVMNSNFSEMNRSVHVMTVAINQMRRDMSIMNNNVSRPMNFMNSFMPW